MDAEQFQRIAKALADPRRFEILEHIAKQAEVGCQRLCGCFPVRQATISHHLKELSSAGLVESRKDGRWIYYKLPGKEAPVEVREAIDWVEKSLDDMRKVNGEQQHRRLEHQAPDIGK